MNAGGVSKACKSNVSIIPARGLSESGKRVRNTLVICLTVGHNSAKAELIPRWSCGDLCHSHVKRKTRCERNLWPISLLAG